MSTKNHPVNKLQVSRFRCGTDFYALILNETAFSSPYIVEHNWSESVFQLLADTYQACENDTQKKMATSVLPSTYIMCNVVCVYVYVSHRCFMGGRASK